MSCASAASSCGAPRASLLAARRRHRLQRSAASTTSSSSRGIHVSTPLRAAASDSSSPTTATTAETTTTPARLEGEQLERLMAVMAEDLTHLFDEQAGPSTCNSFIRSTRKAQLNYTRALYGQLSVVNDETDE